MRLVLIRSLLPNLVASKDCERPRLASRQHAGHCVPRRSRLVRVHSRQSAAQRTVDLRIQGIIRGCSPRRNMDHLTQGSLRVCGYQTACYLHLLSVSVAPLPVASKDCERPTAVQLYRLSDNDFPSFSLLCIFAKNANANLPQTTANITTI